MSTKPYTEEREKDFQKFLKEVEGKSYSKKALLWFQRNLKEIVTADEFARITGTNGKPINHNVRRIFELRDEQGYEIINHKDSESTGIQLKVDEWMLLQLEANPEKIRSRGVNKRIMYEVFERDSFQCQACGRTPNDDDPFAEGKKIKLHVGHIIAHKRKGYENFIEVQSISEIKDHEELTKDDFITMCNVCNEGAKNNDLKLLSNIDKIELLTVNEQQEVYGYLKNKFEK